MEKNYIKEKIELIIVDLLIKIHQSIKNDTVKFSDVELLNCLFRVKNEIK